MKIRNICSITNSVALIAIAFIALCTFQHIMKPAHVTTSHVQPITYYVVDYVQDASSPYDAHGAGTSGFIVRNGDKLEFASYDQMTDLGQAKVLRRLLVSEYEGSHGRTVKRYTPLIATGEWK